MAWIESHQEVGRHPKTKKLARLLSVSLPAAVGHLHYLWWWALDFAPTGSLGKYDEADIADAMQWDGDPATLVEALLASGYVDETDDGLMIHDWAEYAGKLLERRAKDRARKRAAAESAGVPQEFQRKDDGEDEDGGTLPSVPNQPTNRTEHNQPYRTDRTEQDTTAPDQPGGKPPAAEACPLAEIMQLYNETCASYPRIRCIAGSREKAVKARWRQYGDVEIFRELFQKAEASDFLKGQNERNWSATFDWLINANNMAKVLEGNYDGSHGSGARPQAPNGTLDILRRMHEAEGGDEG